MHVSSELLIVLFISFSYQRDVSLKNHELSWFRCMVHQNIVPVTANLTPACPEQSKTWLCRKSILLYQMYHPLSLPINKHSRSYLLPTNQFGLVFYASIQVNIQLINVTQNSASKCQTDKKERGEAER